MGKILGTNLDRNTWTLKKGARLRPPLLAAPTSPQGIINVFNNK